MQELIRNGVESAMDLDPQTWNRSRPRRGPSTASAPETAEPQTSSREKSPGRPERLRSRTEMTGRRDEWQQEVGRMHAVVVAGEHAWGGGMFDDLSCRPLMELAGRPLIAHVLEWLRGQGIRTAGICVNSDSLAVRHALGDGQRLGLSLQYYTDVMPRGPAGCVRDAAIDSGADHVIVVSGMVIPRLGIQEACQQHRATDSAVTVLSCPATAGSLEPSGLYLVAGSALERIPATGYQDIKETLLPKLRRSGARIGLFRTSADDVLRVTDLKSYVLANHRLIEESLAGVCGPEYVRIGDGWVHQACDIDPSVRIIGPAVIGPGCTIEANAVIVGPSAIGMGCRIGRGAVISRSTVWTFANIGQGAVVDNCLLSHNSEVEAKGELRDTFWAKRSRWGTACVPYRVPAHSAVRRLAS